MTVPLSVHAPGQARRSLDRYEGGIEASLLNDLRLVSTELVTNAVRHSGRPQGDPIEFQLNILPGKIRVHVVDQGDGLPQLKPRSSTSGLHLVERLSDRWGSGSHESFTVWLEIDTEPIPIHPQATELRRRR